MESSNSFTRDGKAYLNQESTISSSGTDYSGQEYTDSTYSSIIYDEITGLASGYQFNRERTSEVSSSEYNTLAISYDSQVESSFTIDETIKALMTSSTLEAIESFDRPAMLSVLVSDTTIMEEVLSGIGQTI